MSMNELLSPVVVGFYGSMLVLFVVIVVGQFSISRQEQKIRSLEEKHFD